MWETLAGIGGNIFGALANNAFSQSSQRQQYENQREFYQSQHQWEVNDLKQAGLNPMLSAMHGASTGGGSTSPVITPDFARGIPEMLLKNKQIDEIEKIQLGLNSDTVNSAVSLNKMREVVSDAEAKNLLASANLSSSAAALNIEKAITERAAQGHLFSQTDLAKADAALRPVQASDIRAQAAIRRAELPRHMAEGAMYQSDWGKRLPYVSGKNWQGWFNPQAAVDVLQRARDGVSSSAAYKSAKDFLSNFGNSVRKKFSETIKN